MQKPHPPIWIGGAGEKVTLKLVAQYGDACESGVISRFAQEVFPRLGLRAGLKPA